MNKMQLAVEPCRFNRQDTEFQSGGGTMKIMTGLNGRKHMHTSFIHNGTALTKRRVCLLVLGLGVMLGVAGTGAPLALGGDLLPVTNGLACWFDAGFGVTSDGSGVLTWSDRSGNGHTATRTGGNPALVAGSLNGLPVVEFRGNDDYLNMVNTLFAKTHFA